MKVEAKAVSGLALSLVLALPIAIIFPPLSASRVRCAVACISELLLICWRPGSSSRIHRSLTGGLSQLRHRIGVPARQPCSLACRFDNPMPELTLSSVRDVWIRLQNSRLLNPKTPAMTITYFRQEFCASFSQLHCSKKRTRRLSIMSRSRSWKKYSICGSVQPESEPKEIFSDL